MLWYAIKKEIKFDVDEDQGGVASNLTVLRPPAAGDWTLLAHGKLGCESMN